MAMGSSLAVSLCSLICLIILPFILREGQTPSEGVVRILTGFGVCHTNITSERFHLLLVFACPKKDAFEV